jgi:hypothetical protein
MKNRLGITVMLIMIPFGLLAKQNEEQEQFKKLVEKVFDEFKIYTSNVNIPLGQLVFITTKHTTHTANNNTNISINLDEIETIVRGETTFFKKMFIRFVFAHELAHRLQYAKYPKNTIESAKGEGFTFLECNADILANFICTGIINVIELPPLRQNPDFDLNAYNKNMYRTAIKVYQRIFEMDLHNPLTATHPTNLQRLTAVKAGALLGNCFNMRYVVPPKGNAELKKHQFDIETFKIIAKAIDFSGPQDNPYTWAHSEAVRILNENNSLAKNLVRYGVSVKRERNPGTSERFYNYSFKVFNDNEVPVRFAGRVYSEIDFGNEADNLMKSVPIDANSFERVIPAKSSITVAGRISYIIKDTLSSGLILPGDKKSLYFVFDANSPVTDPSAVLSSDNDFTNWQPGLEEEIYDHFFEILKIRGRLSTYKRGMGTSDANNEEEMKSYNVIYEPSFKAGRHDDQVLIYFPRSQNIIYEFQATETSNLETANKRFDLILSKIKGGVGNDFVFNVIKGGNYGQQVEARDNNNKRVFLLRVLSNALKNTYSIVVGIYGK